VKINGGEAWADPKDLLIQNRILPRSQIDHWMPRRWKADGKNPPNSSQKRRRQLGPLGPERVDERSVAVFAGGVLTAQIIPGERRCGGGIKVAK
jgi:hypothetical protein